MRNHGRQGNICVIKCFESSIHYHEQNNEENIKTKFGTCFNMTQMK